MSRKQPNPDPTNKKPNPPPGPPPIGWQARALKAEAREVELEKERDDLLVMTTIIDDAAAHLDLGSLTIGEWLDAVAGGRKVLKARG